MATALSIVRKFHPEVEEVVDGKKNLTIEVTKATTKSATVRNHRDCALAVQCTRNFNLDGAIISRGMAYLIKNNKATRYSLPPSVQREIVSFDRNGGFEPGVYQLTAPGPAKRLGERRGSAKDSKLGNGHAKRYRHITANIRTQLESRFAA